MSSIACTAEVLAMGSGAVLFQCAYARSFYVLALIHSGTLTVNMIACMRELATSSQGYRARDLAYTYFA